MATPADLAALLRDVLRGEGEGLLDDRARLGAVLRERLPGETRAIHLLLTALDAGIPARLRSGEGQAADGEIGQEASQLVDHFGVAQELARQSVETWAMALGRLPGLGEGDVPTSETPVAEQRHAGAQPEAASRSTQDGASLETPAAQAPRDDDVAKDDGVVLPGLPPLPGGAVGHEDSVLAAPGAPDATAQANPDLRPILPRPPDLPVPSPASTGPVPREAGESGAAPELPPVRALPPVQQLPPVQALPPVKPLPAVQPLPQVQALPEVRPLPAAAPKPLPQVQPLPPSGAPPVQPLPGPRPLPASGSILPPAPPGSGPQPAPVPASRPAWIGWGAALLGLVAIGFGLMQIFGSPAETPVKPPDPPPRSDGAPPRVPDRPSATGGQTAEGFPIVDAQTEPDLTARPLEGNPNTLLFAFGLRFGQETYTYQAAVDFTRGDASGVGLVKVFKGGRESATGELRTSRSIQSNGYLGFTMSGPMRGAVSAPNVCVSALVGKTPGRFDLANGGGLFCAFATKPDGVCDGDVKIGCGKLVP